MRHIARAQGSSRLFTFVQEAAETGTAWAADGCDVIIDFHDREDAARGMVIQQERDEFLLVGSGFSVRFRCPRPDGRPRHVKEAELGEFEGDAWRLHHPIRRERLEAEGDPVTLLEPGVVLVRLVSDATV